MMFPLSRLDLDAAGCGTPNCGHDHTVLYLTAACHPRAGHEVSYDKRICKKSVAQIRVAAAPQS